MFKKILNVIYNGGIPKKDYRNIKGLVSEQNWKFWRIISAILGAGFVTLFISTFIFKGIEHVRYYYLGISVYFLVAIFLLHFYVDKNHPIMLYLVIYTCVLVTFSFGITLGTFLSKDTYSVAFMVMLLALPLVIVDKPYRLITMNIVVSLSFILIAYFVKERSLFENELINTLTYFFFSSFVVTYLVRIRLKAFVQEYETIEKMRIDSLTGLGNELSYLEMKEKFSKDIKDRKPLEFAIVVMDVNNIKTNNDKYGHMFGCSMIVETGHYLKTAFPNSYTFHIGGDEFVAVLVDEDYKNRDKLIEAFDEKMKNFYITVEGIEIRVTVARGVAEFDKDNDIMYSIPFKRADALMYENKKYIKAKYNLPER